MRLVWNIATLIFADFHRRGNRLRGDASPVRAGGMALFTDCLDIS